MTLSAWMSVALYALLCIGAGRCILYAFRLPKDPLSHNWASCYLAGQLIVLFLTLVTAFVPIPIGALQVTLAVIVLLAGAAYLFRQPLPLGKMLLSGATAFLLVGLLFPDVWLVTQYTPLYEWDARSYWFFHGKVVWFDGGVKSAFFANPDSAWSHCDYPLFMAAQSAWLSAIAGGWHDITAKAFLWINFAAYADLFRRVLQRGCRHWWFWFPAVILAFDQETYSYVSGIADPHYAMPLILFMAACCIPGAANPAFLALMLALAANMKNEASVYVVLLLAAIAGVRLRRLLCRGRKDDAATASAGNLASLWFGLAVGFAPWLAWSAYRCIHGIEERDRIIALLFDGHTFFANLPHRALPILSYFLDNYMFRHAPVLLAALLLIVFFRRLRCRVPAGVSEETHRHRYLWLVFAVLNVLVFLPYVVTTWDLALHLATSAGRLLLLPFLVLILVLIEEVRRTISCFDSPPAPGSA